MGEIPPPGGGALGRTQALLEKVRDDAGALAQQVPDIPPEVPGDFFQSAFCVDDNSLLSVVICFGDVKNASRIGTRFRALGS